MKYDDQNVFGPDYSFWQDDDTTPGKIDFHKTKAEGSEFVIIRAGQNYWIDSDFKDNWRLAREAGLPRGAYWFYDSRAEAQAQADIFMSCFKNDPPELELWLDLEENYGGPFAGYLHWKRFLDRIAGYDNGIYTSNGYIRGKIPVSEYPYFKRKKLWLANYGLDAGVKPDPSFIKVAAPWDDEDVKYWQWGTPAWGKRFGAESIEIDMNLYNGSKLKFRTTYNLPLIDLPPTVPETPEGETMERYFKLNTTGANIRGGPGANNPDLGDLAFGDVVKAVEIQGNWTRFTDAQHANGSDVVLVNGTKVIDETREMWSTNAYFTEVDKMPLPRMEEPEEPEEPNPDPPETLPAYLTAYNENGDILGHYDLRE